ncbi:MAG: hypothetical protein V1870_03990 [Candidatus Aenigmatarchaeota archaeon]
MKIIEKEEKSSISRNERILLEKLKNTIVFDIETAARISGWKKKNIYQLIDSMKKKGLIMKIGAGKYVVCFPDKPDISEIVTKIIWPSYVSFWTALSRHGFTEQLPRTYFLVTTRMNRKMSINNIEIIFVKLSASRFFGYEKRESIVIADKEKSIIDSFLLSRYSGGIEEVFKCLCNAWDELDIKKLMEYALRMNNKSLLKRLGYLIEVASLRIDKEHLKTLQKKLGKGFSLLDPQLEKKGELEKKWQLVLNVSKEQLFSWKRIM